MIVKAGYGNSAVGLSCREEIMSHRYVDGVGHGTAIDPAVQVAVGAGNFYLEIAEAAQTGGDARGIVRYHRGI
jgi:hypothetical protein